MTSVQLLTLREPSVFTSKVETPFMHEGTKLWTSFTSPRRLNTEFLSFARDELENLSPVLILVKTEGFGDLPPLTL